MESIVKDDEILGIVSKYDTYTPELFGENDIVN